MRARKFAFIFFDDEPRLEEQAAQPVADALALSDTLVKAAQKLAQETAGLSENLSTQHIQVPVSGGRSRRFAFAFFDDEPRLEEQAPGNTVPLNDSLSMTETLVKRAQKALAENPAFTESTNLPTAKLLADNLALTEQLLKQVQRRASESAGFTESLSGGFDLPALTETFAFTENLAKLVVKTLSISDSIVFMENLTKTVIPGGPISPAGSRARRFAFMLFDDEPRGEEQGGAQTSFQGMSDTVALTENLNRVVTTAAKTDAALLTEALHKSVTRVVAETMSLSENDFARVSTAVADTLSLSEAFATVQVKIQSMADTVGLTESLQKAVSRAIDETISLHEDLVPGNNRSLADQIAFSETLRSSVSRAIAETATLTENAAAIAAKLQSVSDALSATESLSKRVIRAIQETLIPTEAMANLETRLAYADFVNFTESTQKAIARSVNESIGLTENLVAGILRLLNTGDVVSLTEQLLTGIVARGRFKLVEKKSGYRFGELKSLYGLVEVAP